MRSPAKNILKHTPSGLYCPAGDFFIDPGRKVARALITHGHADHARRGHAHVLATAPTHDFMQVRYGRRYCGQGQVAVYGKPEKIGEVSVTFCPAGHVLGSAQIAIDLDGWRLVVSGDFKRQPDPTCEPFEVVACDTLITEATFALPLFRFPAIRDEIGRLLSSMRLFADRPHYLGAYSLGKAQRLIGELRAAGYQGPIHVPDSVLAICAVYEAHGIALGDLRGPSDPPADTSKPVLYVGPSGPENSLHASTDVLPIRAFASGWNHVRGRTRQPDMELPLVISDHADWDDLCATITQCGAREVWVTHGEGAALVHWCTLQGLSAQPLSQALADTPGHPQ